MKTFNKQFKIHSTKVKLEGAGNAYYRVDSIDIDRELITVSGLLGYFQRAHVLTYTNKALKGYDY